MAFARAPRPESGVDSLICAKYARYSLDCWKASTSANSPTPIQAAMAQEAMDKPAFLWVGSVLYGKAISMPS